MKIYIETLGCPKNLNDSEIAEGILQREGFEITKDYSLSDCVIVNTCGFINDAKKESIDRIFELLDNNKLFIVSGCLSKRYGEELYKEMPEVDIFIGVNEYDRLPQIIRNHKKGKREKYIGSHEKEIDFEKRNFQNINVTSTIKISEGCDNRCTYCIIPSIRGKYRSRSIDSIVDEAVKVAKNGAKEIILIGQDVTNYGIDLYREHKLHVLLKELCKIEDIRWIRLMYCYEDKITDELISVMAEETKICNYIDIPIQHISDRVLEAMNRNSTRASILEKIEKLRKTIPDIAIRTTLIVGFPGETEEEFDELYEFVKKTKFDRLGVFAYSQEEGTVAAEMKEQISDNIKEERKDAIMRLQMLISKENNEKLMNKELEVLIESTEEDVYIGRTQYDAPEIDNNAIVKTNHDYKLGDFVKILVEDAYDYDIVGRDILK